MRRWLRIDRTDSQKYFENVEGIPLLEQKTTSMFYNCVFGTWFEGNSKGNLQGEQIPRWSGEGLWDCSLQILADNKSYKYLS